ncbi:MAG: TIM barrel protein [bacterium]|nr:TIM barrel protein [bacterium]
MSESTDTITREYGISLAEWSLHRTIGAGEGKVPHLDLPKVARQDFDIGAVELVSTMLAATDPAYLDEYARNAAANDVKTLLIMVDNEGAIASPDPDDRAEAVTRHCAWIDIAATLGCHSIRLNWHGVDADAAKRPLECRDVIARSVAPFRALCDHGDKKNINVVIENHGGPSSYPEAMVQLMTTVDHERFGTLPDFGNFPGDVDRYLATDLLMNFAKAVSAKCVDFDDATGDESTMDYGRLIEIVCDKHGYEGYIGIEYGGGRLSEYEGIAACKRLLERLKTA